MTTDFSQGRVSARIVTQAVPLTLAQLVQLLYSIVDRIYIGHLPGLGSAALTGVGLTFPVVTLIAAFTALFSMGGTPLTMLATGLNGFINAQGFPRVGMLTTVIGAACNLALDPLFIFALGMGVPGAAGVFLAEPISNFLGGLACFATMYITVYRKLGTAPDRQAAGV